MAAWAGAVAERDEDEVEREVGVVMTEEGDEVDGVTAPAPARTAKQVWWVACRPAQAEAIVPRTA